MHIMRKSFENVSRETSKRLHRDLLLSHVLGGGHVGGRLQCADDVRPLASVLVELSSFRDEVRETGADRRREVVVQLGAVEHRAALDAHHALSLQLAAFLGHCGHTLIHLPTYATHQQQHQHTVSYRIGTMLHVGCVVQR